jgi:hypothetical protein
MKRKSRYVRIAVIILIILCMIPARLQYKDGGSVSYRAVLYEVTKWHQLSDEEADGFRDGSKSRYLG